MVSVIRVCVLPSSLYRGVRFLSLYGGTRSGHFVGIDRSLSDTRSAIDNTSILAIGVHHLAMSSFLTPRAARNLSNYSALFIQENLATPFTSSNRELGRRLRQERETCFMRESPSFGQCRLLLPPPIPRMLTVLAFHHSYHGFSPDVCSLPSLRTNPLFYAHPVDPMRMTVIHPQLHPVLLVYRNVHFYLYLPPAGRSASADVEWGRLLRVQSPASSIRPSTCSQVRVAPLLTN